MHIHIQYYYKGEHGALINLLIIFFGHRYYYYQYNEQIN